MEVKWSNFDLSSPDSRKKQFTAVDIMKLLCAILVVTIHEPPFKSINEYLNYGLSHCISRLAVPFFFVASGFFCFRKTALHDFDVKIPIAYAKRIFILYVAWSVIYFPQICYGIYTNKKGVLRGILSAARTIMFSGYSHLWYLLSVAVAVVIITVAIKKRISIEKILFIGGVLYIVGLLGQSYFELLRPFENTIVWSACKLYAKVFTTTRNGIFEGILFLGIGVLFAYRKIEIQKNIAIGGLITSILFLLIEAFSLKYFTLTRATDMYIMLVPSVFFLFYIVSHIEVKKNVLFKQARTYSSLIYFTHNWIRFPILSLIIVIIERYTGVDEYAMHSLLRFCIVITGSFIASYMIIHLQNFRVFRWLKKLY